MSSLSVGDVTLEFAPTGPRITGLRVRGGENLFAELPGAVIERPGGRPFRLLGGHRLWLAPEIPEITYEPDDDPVRFVATGASMTARGAADARGIIREIAATVTPGGTVVVDHRITNTGETLIEAAPWAITQFPPDGAAVLPVRSGTPTGGYRADRSVVLWPYTDPGSPGFRWGRDAVVVAGSAGAKQKIGAENRAGWIAYQRGNHLFVTWADVHDDTRVYVDRGASVQVYRDRRFIELETLGSLRVVEPGATISHREEWGVYDTGPIPIEILAETARRTAEDFHPGP